MDWPLARQLAIRPRRRQPVQLSSLNVAQRPAGQPSARVQARQADPHIPDDAGVAVDLESERQPNIRHVRDRQLIDSWGHTQTVAVIRLTASRRRAERVPPPVTTSVVPAKLIE